MEKAANSWNVNKKVIFMLQIQAACKLTDTPIPYDVALSNR